MASVDDFLKDSPHLAAPKKKSGDVVTLDVVITAAVGDTIDFVHLGGNFSAAKEYVIDISDSERKVAAARGKSAVLTLKPTARLEWKRYITASDLDASIPLGYALPTAHPPAARSRAAAAAWGARVGFAPADISTIGSTCDSYSEGVSDDSKHDDW